jgi:hypothetical protein
MTHNAITMEAARKLESKLIASDIPLAVFVLYGSWQVTKTNTKNYAELCRKTPERLVGVYDVTSPVSWIAEDFEACGIK